MIGYGEVSSPSSFCFGSRKKFQWKSIVSRTLLLCVDIKATTTRNTEIETYWQNLLLKIGSGRSSKMKKIRFFLALPFEHFYFCFFSSRFGLFHYLAGKNYCAMALWTAWSLHKKHMSTEILHLIWSFYEGGENWSSARQWIRDASAMTERRHWKELYL